MAFAAFAGYFLIGLGPGLAIFVLIITPKAFLVILTLSSAFFWLIALILTACLWRTFIPFGDSVGLYATLLVTAVAIQEASRLLYWRMFSVIERKIDAVAAAQRRPRLSPLDHIQMALASGLGHGSAHSALSFLSLLTPTLGAATFYTKECPQIPFFLAAAILSSAVLLFHTFSMVLAFDAFSSRPPQRKLVVPALHLIQKLLMLVGLAQRGCIASLFLAWACTIVMVVLSGKVMWSRLIGHRPPPLPHRTREHHDQ